MNLEEILENLFIPENFSELDCDFCIPTDYKIGATKVCILLEDKVIKIPFTHQLTFEEEIIPLTKAKEFVWDYCALEVSYYQKAKELNLNQYFAKEEYLTSINNYPIYIQERVIPFNEYYSFSSFSSKELYNINEKWIKDFIKFYGENELKRLISFLKTNEITDLRETNIGYRENRPRIFDYSGWREWHIQKCA